MNEDQTKWVPENSPEAFHVVVQKHEEIPKALHDEIVAALEAYGKPEPKAKKED